MRLSRFVLVLSCLLALGAQAGSAQNGASQSYVVGPLDVVAASNTYHAGILTYKMAHIKGKNGLTIDADTVEINLANKVSQMYGHVKAHIRKAEVSQDMTVNSDKAVFDQVKNQIDLTGNVKVVILSTYTSGPLIQTGDSAVMKLGPAPEFPEITMDNVHTSFTPQQ
jgi:hypothetical protein